MPNKIANESQFYVDSSKVKNKQEQSQAMSVISEPLIHKTPGTFALSAKVQVISGVKKLKPESDTNSLISGLPSRLKQKKAQENQSVNSTQPRLHFKLFPKEKEVRSRSSDQSENYCSSSSGSGGMGKNKSRIRKKKSYDTNIHGLYRPKGVKEKEKSPMKSKSQTKQLKMDH